MYPLARANILFSEEELAKGNTGLKQEDFNS